ncbi:hypothetical protein NEOLI_000816 [Neolecta irregularis DAH-3]|uniref:Uncharacterized protein n=1 Tax=Neolecta irregularis (strain DAH-3) TaxID=1198029 RepID=A0A1U7LRE0_NEOID|nr:hypothetical protein NEOLI_000816 [Neolecta irregularis DAH-3]|eukprot:OLL25240.1 hypothetical protein NEOLI_000816 [Neolecta irregularis DAH-3]
MGSSLSQQKSTISKPPHKRSKKSVRERRSSLSSDDQVQLPLFKRSDVNIDSAFYREARPAGTSIQIETSRSNIENEEYVAGEDIIPLPQQIFRTSESNPYSSNSPSFVNMGAFKRGSLRVTNVQTDSPISSPVGQSIQQHTFQGEEPWVNVDNIDILNPSNGARDAPKSTPLSEDIDRNNIPLSSYVCARETEDKDGSTRLSRNNSAKYWRQTAIRARSNRNRISWISDDDTQYHGRSGISSSSQSSQKRQGREERNTDDTSPSGSFSAGDDNHLNATLRHGSCQILPQSKVGRHRSVPTNSISHFGEMSRRVKLVQSEPTGSFIPFREGAHKHRRRPTRSESFNSELVAHGAAYPRKGAYSHAPVRNSVPKPTYREGLYPYGYSTDSQLYCSAFPKTYPQSAQLSERSLHDSAKSFQKYKRMSFPSIEMPKTPASPDFRDITCPKCSYLFPSVDAMMPIPRNPRNYPETKRRASIP